MLLRILSNIVRSLGNVCEIILFLTRGDVDDVDNNNSNNNSNIENNNNNNNNNNNKNNNNNTPVLHQLHWLPVSFRFNFKILLLTVKAIHELGPSYIIDLVEIKPLNSRYTPQPNVGILLSHPNFKPLTILGDPAFVASALKLWNDLPLEIRMAKSVDTLKNF